MTNPVEIVEALTQIISIQSDAINELFQLLMLHVAADELDRLPCVERINRAAALLDQIAPGGR